MWPLGDLCRLRGAANRRLTAWLLLLVGQACLVASGRIALHRRVGSVGGFLVVPMLVTGTLAAIAAGRGEAPISSAVARGELTMASPGLPPLEAMVIPLTTMVLFGAFAGAGLVYRRRPETLKHFMALATIAMLPPAIGRATIRAVRLCQPRAVLRWHGSLCPCARHP